MPKSLQVHVPEILDLDRFVQNNWIIKHIAQYTILHNIPAIEDGLQTVCLVMSVFFGEYLCDVLIGGAYSFLQRQKIRNIPVFQETKS